MAVFSYIIQTKCLSLLQSSARDSERPGIDHQGVAIFLLFMYFVPWFITTYLLLYVKVLERSYQENSGNIVRTVYPPQAPFILPNNTGITFSVFQKFSNNEVAKVTVAKINNLISQNNYLSLYVKVLGEHISSLDKKLDIITTLIKNLSDSQKSYDIASTSESKSKDLTAKPHIQTPPDIEGFQKPTALEQL